MDGAIKPGKFYFILLILITFTLILPNSIAQEEDIEVLVQEVENNLNLNPRFDDLI